MVERVAVERERNRRERGLKSLKDKFYIRKSGVCRGG